MRLFPPMLALLCLFVCGCTTERRPADAASADSTVTVDSSSDSASDGGGIGCGAFESPNRSCEDISGCVVFLHQSDCCGSTRALGVSGAVVPELEAAESMCSETYPDCGCAVGPTVADDGTMSDAGSPASVSCESGVCTTTFPG